jgi:serine/threonine-protein phosphatase 5
LLSATIDLDSFPVEEAYDGPRLGDDGVVTDEFAAAAMERYRDQKLVHKRYVIQVKKHGALFFLLMLLGI